MEDDDEDLEAELAALAAGNDAGYKGRHSGEFCNVFYIIAFYMMDVDLCGIKNSFAIIAARKAAANANLDNMVADCMKDTNSDEEPSQEADDDPALLVRDVRYYICSLYRIKFIRI